MRLLRALAISIAWLLGSADVALSQIPFPLTVTGKSASATISLPGGLGIDLLISFEEVVGLNAEALELSATVVSPLDLGLVSRLPGGAASIPAGLPVLLRIEPTQDSGLSMSGVVTISLHTHNLDLDLLKPFVLFSAPLGGQFRDITRTVSMGSYRVDGSGGGFSEFLIARDDRSIDTIINEKFGIADGLLAEHGSMLPSTILSVLQERLLLARTSFLAGLTEAALGEVGAFGEIVRAQSGKVIPDVWRANDPRTNIAGLLRAAADTLKFSLTVKANRLK